MSIMISAFPAQPSMITDVAFDEVKAASFSLSEGNWMEHIQELFLDTDMRNDASFSICDISKEAEDYIDYHDGKILRDHTRWHVGIARKILALANAGRKAGCDRIGSIG